MNDERMNDQRTCSNERDWVKVQGHIAQVGKKLCLYSPVETLRNFTYIRQFSAWKGELDWLLVVVALEI